MDEARGATGAEAEDGDEGWRACGDSDVVVAGGGKRVQRGTDRNKAA